jgi:hypothetical protein
MPSNVDIRTAFQQGGKAVLDQISRPVVAAKWDAESALSKMSTGALVAHLAKCLVLVETFLDAPLPDSEPFDAVHFYARLTETKDVDSQYNQTGRQKGEEAAEKGRETVIDELAGVLDRLGARLPQEPTERIVALVNRPGDTMVLDEYLKTRCVEIAVHLRDLAVSCGWQPSVPESVEQVAIDVAVGVAQARHGNGILLDALYRGERLGTTQVFPVL